MVGAGLTQTSGSGVRCPGGGGHCNNFLRFPPNYVLQVNTHVESAVHLKGS